MVVSAIQAEVTAQQTRRTRRARLTPEEHRQIVELYADPQVPNADIRKRFAITDTSLYRLLQQHGVPPRRRSASRTSGAGTPSPKGAPASTAARVLARQTTSVSAAPNGQAAREFRIDFRAERIVEADNVRAALQQAELAGANEVTAIVRQ